MSLERINKGWIVTALLFALIFCIRLPYIANSPYEYQAGWRQSDTESVARNFLEHRFSIFYPQFNYDGPMPNYVQLEFQIVPYLIAVLYFLFGYHYFLARLVVIAFFMGSCVFVYLIAQRYYDDLQAWFALLIYGFLPINVFLSRAIMPEAAVLFFFTGAFYFFSRWYDTEQLSHLIWSGAFVALAISQKIPAVFIGLPMLIMMLVKYRYNVLKMWQLYVFAAISLMPPTLYYWWAAQIAEFKFVEGIATKHILQKFHSAIFTPEALRFFAVELPQAFTWIGLALVLVGFLLTRWKTEYPIAAWAIAVGLELVTIVAVIKFNYYLVFLSPVVALLGGKALGVLVDKLQQDNKGLVVAVLLIAALGYRGWVSIQPYYSEKNSLLKQARVVQKLTNPEDLIVTATLSPELLNASNRAGWRANIKYYEHIPTEPEAELEYFIAKGVKYFVPVQGYIYGDESGEYRRLLEDNYERLELEPGYYIYRLGR